MADYKPHDGTAHHLGVEGGEKRNSIPHGQLCEVHSGEQANIGSYSKTAEVNYVLIKSPSLSIAALLWTSLHGGAVIHTLRLFFL